VFLRRKEALFAYINLRYVPELNKVLSTLPPLTVGFGFLIWVFSFAYYPRGALGRNYPLNYPRSKVFCTILKTP
jgi:hypothetical protein